MTREKEENPLPIEATIATSPMALALAAKTREVLAAPHDERADLLIASDDVAAIVPRIPPEELLFTLRASPRESAVTVLSNARPSQLRFVLDMEIWRDAEVDPERAAKWLTALDGCGQQTLGRVSKTFELPDLAAMLGRLVTASMADEDGNPEKDDEEGRGSFTLDGAYYFHADQDLIPAVRNLMINLRNNDPSKYAHLLETLLTGFDVEDEELAGRFRQARISERGFLTFDEAQGIYAQLDAETLKNLSGTARDARSDANPEGYDPPSYPVSVNHGSGRLRRILDRLASTGDGGALMQQIARLTNKVVAADSLDTGVADSFNRAAWKVSGYLTVGIETLFGNDEEAMVRALEAHHLQHLFQVGWMRIRLMTQKARRMLRESWPLGKMERLLLLDPPMPEVLNGILRRRPMWLDQTARGDELRDFANLAEVELAERVIEKADFVGRYLVGAIEFSLDSLARAAVKLEDEDLKARTIFITALVNAALERGFRFAPVTGEEALDGLARLWQENTMPRQVSPRFMEQAIHWSEERMEIAPLERQFLIEFLAHSIELIEEQFGNLALDEVPDPRFLKGLWIE